MRTIEELREIQRRSRLGAFHVVELGEFGFVIAHTDAERSAGVSLFECGLHAWLTAQNGPPVDVGLYVAFPHEPDAYSESYGADPWDFEPIEATE